MSQPRTRQELYDRIRETSKEELVLEEMVRLGFWPAAGKTPEDPADEIRRRGELERELRALQTENFRLENVEALKKEARRRRLLESKQKQKETKERRERERIARAEAWAKKKQQDIVFLGPRVSSGLGAKDPDVERLRKQGLPILSNAEDLARAMEISIGQLRFLAFDRRTSKVSHYKKFTIPKRSGGVREISAPMKRLKTAQRWILENILSKVTTHSATHGFALDRSIVTNALPHAGSDVIVNLDLEDFFPTVVYRRVKGMFRKLGYGNQVATVLALISTEPDTTAVEVDKVLYHVARTERRLPQGAPSSPAITNIICRRLDRRLAGLSRKLAFTYTRYADDLTFSGSATADVKRLLARVRYVLKAEGFVIHPKKTRIARKGRRQEVTGIVVNSSSSSKLRVPREDLRRFRATLFQIEKDGPDGKRWGSSKDVLASVHGFASFVCMVDPIKGKPLLARTKALLEKHGRKPPRKPPPKVEPKKTEEAKSEAPADGKKPWWKFW